ncbi:MAG: hypothetical protein BWK75_05930 [Candidatus Altiarchaeales archaeon A3]|nr:MAG: hypothetical protein BWK75_05930 [Candidatus Altiarchaeales archaeon A3]
MKTQISQYPRLDEVLMVEEIIREHSGEFKKRRLWESLPEKVAYQTYCTIIDYLSGSQKIAVDKERKIGWTYNPKLVKKYLKPELIVR